MLPICEVDPVEMLEPLRMRHIAEAAAEQPEVEPETQQEDSPREDRRDPPRRAFWRQQDDNTREQGQEDNSGKHSMRSPFLLAYFSAPTAKKSNHQYHDDAAKHRRAIVLEQARLRFAGDVAAHPAHEASASR